MLQDYEYPLWNTLLCTSGTYKSCSGPWSKFNNVITLKKVMQYDKVRVGVHLRA